MICCKAIVACSTSEFKFKTSQGVETGFEGVHDSSGVVLRFVGGDKGVLKEIGRPERASRQSGESERF